MVAAVAEFQETRAVKRGSARIWWFDNTASSTEKHSRKQQYVRWENAYKKVL